MAEGNRAHKPEAMMTEFHLGGQVFQVPPLSLYVLDVCQADIVALEPDTSFAEYAKHVLRIVSVALDRPELMQEAFLRTVTIPEMRAVVTATADLFANSGFLEAAMEPVPGTGTLNLSSPNSQQTASSPEISTQ